MGENEVFEYSLTLEEEELRLKMSKVDKNIRFSIEDPKGKKYSIMILSSQIQELYKAYQTSMTLNEFLIFLHNIIESGDITLIKDEMDKSIELKFKVKSEKNFPDFGVKMKLENLDTLKKKITKLQKKIINILFRQSLIIEEI